MLVLRLERGTDDPGRGVVDDDVERRVGGELRDDPRRGDVPAHEDGLGARRAHLLGRLLGRCVVPHVAEDDAGGAVAGEAERDRPPDPACPAGDEDPPALGAHSLGGSGS